MSNKPHRRPKRAKRPAPEVAADVPTEAQEVPDRPSLTPARRAYRLFGLDEDGTLVAPFVDRYWPGSAEDRTWPNDTKYASCIAEDHDAPGETCSCGICGVKSWPAFIAAVTTGGFAGSPVPVIEECPVIATVRLLGRSFPSSEINDPPTTFRAQAGVVESIHLAPIVDAELAQAVADRYPRARCYRQTERAWPTGITEHAERVWATPTTADIAAFRAAVRKAGFGTLTVKEINALAPGLGESAVEALRDHASPEDLASVLFDTAARPTFQQAKTLVLAAAEHLAHDLNFTAAGYRHTRPIPMVESMARTFENVAGGMAKQ